MIIREILQELRGKNQQEVYDLLKDNQDLDSWHKNLLWTYLFPEPIGHYELPKIIIPGRGNHPEGSLDENQNEILTLVRAYSGRQYKRFILHLLHSFIEKPGAVFVQDEEGQCECAICGKKIYYHRDWEKHCSENPAFGEQYRKEYLAFSSEETELGICLDCLVQLQGLHKVLMELEGPNYLVSYPRWGTENSSKVQ